jgi:hypothetical protein
MVHHRDYAQAVALYWCDTFNIKLAKRDLLILGVTVAIVNLSGHN